MTEEEFKTLKNNILIGYKYIPDYYPFKIISPTPEEFKKIKEQEEKEERQENRKEIFTAIKVACFIGLLVTISMGIPWIIFSLISLL